MASGIYKKTKQHCINLSKAKLGKKNPNWKGDKVGYGALHEYVGKRKKKPKLCEECNKRPVLDLANISGKYKRDLSDWRWLCRKCHMSGDGRSEQLRQFGKSRKLLNKICLKCNKSFHRDNRKAKYCSRQCFYERNKK